MVILPAIALLSYTAKEGGIQQNVLTMIPSGEWCAIIVNILMYISILCSYPIYCPPINEIIEASGKGNEEWWYIVEHPTHKGLFVSDGRRLVLRIVQTLAIATVAYLVPNFGDIVSLDIL